MELSLSQTVPAYIGAVQKKKLVFLLMELVVD